MTVRKGTLTRRQFTNYAPALLGYLSAACGHDQRAIVSDEGDETTETGGGSGTDAGGSPNIITPEPPSDGGQGGAGGTPTCGDYTATNIEGPFFKANSIERSDIRQGLPGRKLTLQGTVVGPDCQPLAGALLDFWQADEAGAYDNEGDTFRGHQFTNENGEYALESIVPGRYLNGAQFRPAHIHVKVSAGGETLTTQLYFPDDPFNEVDAFIHFSLLVKISNDEPDHLRAEFDFLIRSA